MAHPIWTTPAGNLGLVPENNFYQLQLAATYAVSYKALAGSLPPGMYVTSAGSLQGVPVVTDVTASRSYEFSIRATSGDGLVTDRTFSLTVSNIIPPQITPKITNLGDVFDGNFYSLQLEAIEANPNATLTWGLVSGTLPGNVSISSSGLISGFIYPLPVQGNAGFTGFNAAPYNEFGYENAPQYQNGTYQFTVRVFDGINYDSFTYKLNVVAKDHFEADTTLDTIDATLTVDQDNKYLPIITTPSQPLPTIRSNSKVAFQFQALDPNYNALTFGLYTGAGSTFDQGSTDNVNVYGANSNAVFGTDGVSLTYTGLNAAGIGFDSANFDAPVLALPGGLHLDAGSGWLYGTASSQAAASQTYTFQIYAYETTSPSYASLPVQYQLTVLGDITNTITWNTSANLGVIDNGAISEFAVSATSNAGKSLVYSLVTDNAHLPQGLELLSSGLIAGRTTFNYFKLDNGNTTVDGVTSLFDNTYKFTVMASTTDGTATSTQQFTITVNNFNEYPYENLYLKALPTIDQRQTFLSIVNNTEIFPTNLLYRPTDPWFGRAKDIRSLFLAGLNPSSAASYTEAMQTNTYKKRIEFGSVKTAQAVDANFNTKYEVVYVELKDDAVYNGKSPANVDYDAVISANVYPNSFTNMSSVITNSLGYENQGALPEWMTSPQTNKKQLGFTKAIVLAYTIPGASNLIAYRLKANGVAFNNIDFVLDRYDLDNTLSANFNSSTGKFISGKETTFDRIKRPAKITHSAGYAVSGLAFDMINNQTVASIQARGGLDGVTYFNTGDTLIFLQQENYPGESNANDGWNLPNGSVVPGFLANKLNSSVVNQRSGIWQINIDSSNIVTLSFVGTVNLHDYVQINYGLSQNNTIVYYDPVLKPGNSVPSYTILQTYLSSSTNNTRFDNYGTRFINNRDSYSDPGAKDTWLKFPKIGEFL
jgi:hypothetical protein